MVQSRKYGVWIVEVLKCEKSRISASFTRMDRISVEEKINYASGEEALELVKRLLLAMSESHPSVVQEALRTFNVSGTSQHGSMVCCMAPDRNSRHTSIY